MKFIISLLLLSNVCYAKDTNPIKTCTERLAKEYCEPGKDKPYCDLGIFAICKDRNGDYDKARNDIQHFPK
jgi:hypothetical protein